MACVKVATSSLIITLLVFLPLLADGFDLLPPVVSPEHDQVCNNVVCGKGKCKPNSNSSFFYECQCDPGWKQAASNDTGLMFLPCVIPNCSMDYSCGAAPAPVQDKSIRANYSIFNPCFWSECGSGSCNKTSQFTYKCICPEGYYNLLKIATFPCIRDCSIGIGCTNLGITIFPHKSTSPPPPPPTNKATSIAPGNILWLIMLWTSLATIWRR